MKALRSIAYGFAALTLMSAAATAASTSVSGNVGVTGTVGGLCVVVGEQSTSSTFTGLIDLGELTLPGGRLNTGITATPVSFQVVCNTSAPSVSMSASSLVGETAPPDGSYTNVVGYTAHLALTETSGTEYVDAISENSGTPTASTKVLALPLAAGSDNVTVSVDTLTSDGGILTVGNYGAGNPAGTGGIISITISPT